MYKETAKTVSFFVISQAYCIFIHNFVYFFVGLWYTIVVKIGGAVF